MNADSASIPLVVVVVLNRNGNDVIKECLLTLKESDYDRVEICLVDNASDDGSPDWVEENYPDVHVIRNAANLGWSAANNIGIRYALAEGADFVWVLNNDVEVEPNCISELVRYAQARPAAGVISPVIHFFSPRDKVWFAGGEVSMERFEAEHCERVEDFRALPQTRRFVSGCALFVRASVFADIGLIDERFVHYYEDTDFCIRAGKKGYEIEVVESALMYHKVGAYFSENIEREAFRWYHLFRSGLIFWRRQLGWWGFHRRYCAAQLGKWLNDVDTLWASEKTRPKAEAVIDALWYYFTAKRDPFAHPKPPPWFKSSLLTRPWLIPELMAFRFVGLVKGGFRRKKGRTKLSS